jgi:O-antigen/teichoic acid export membrane protein
MRRQGAINLAGALVRIAAAVIAVPVTVRFCGLDEFGRWSFLLSVATVLATCDAGLPTTVNVYVSRGLGLDSGVAMAARVSYVTVSSLVVAGLMGSLASGFALAGPALPAVQKFFGAGPADVVLAVSMGLFVGSRILTNVAAAFLQAAANYRAFVLIGFIFVLPTAVGMPLAASLGLGAGAFLHIHTFFSVLTLIAYLIAVSRMRREHAWGRAVDRTEWSGMFRFGLASWLASAGGIMFSQLDRVVVGMLLNTQQLGIYGASTSITSQINALSAITVQPLLPYISRYAHDIQTHVRELRMLVSNAIRLNTAVALVLSGLVVVCAPTVARLLLGSDETRAVTLVVRVLATVYGAYSLNAVGFYSLFATHDVKRLGLITIGSGLLTLATIAWGAHVAGLLGAAIGNVTFVLTFGLTVVALRRFHMSILHWLRMIWVPVCAWMAAVVSAFAFEIQGRAEVGIAGMLLIVMAAWTFMPSRGKRASIVLMESANR